MPTHQSPDNATCSVTPLAALNAIAFDIEAGVPPSILMPLRH